jgi:hypothetical protein
MAAQWGPLPLESTTLCVPIIVGLGRAGASAPRASATPCMATDWGWEFALS